MLPTTILEVDMLHWTTLLLLSPLLVPAELPGRDPSPGELVITELMVDPAAVSDARGEYLEVTNRAPDTLQLLGLVVRDTGTDWCPVERPLLLAPGGRVVFARKLDPATNGGLFPAYPCPGHGLHLNNEKDTVLLDWYGVTLDEVTYEQKTWPMEPGRAMELDPACLDGDFNDAPEVWRAAQGSLPSGDRGSPGW